MISRRKKIFSFGITAVLLVGLFLFSVNTGSLKVTPLELFKGLFVAYNENVATIFDLRFPRIFIAKMCIRDRCTSRISSKKGNLPSPTLSAKRKL